MTINIAMPPYIHMSILHNINYAKLIIKTCIKIYVTKETHHMPIIYTMCALYTYTHRYSIPDF